MTVNEIPNIEHCIIEPMVNGTMLRIIANEGWYIHLDDGYEDTVNVWKGAVIIRATYDFTKVIILPESELPEDAEICGYTTNEPEHEIM